MIWEKFWNAREDEERQHWWRVDLRGIGLVPGDATSIWRAALERVSKEERWWLLVLNGIVASQVACCLHVGLSRGYWLSWARPYRGSICYPSPLEALISFHPCCLSASVVVVLLRALRIRMHRRMFVWSMILAFWLSSWTAAAILFDSPYSIFTWTLKHSDAERAWSSHSVPKRL